MFHNLCKQILFLTCAIAPSLIFHLSSSCIRFGTHEPQRFHVPFVIHFCKDDSICCEWFVVCTCNIPHGMLWVGSGCHHVCAWGCARWMSLYLFQLLTQVLLWLLAGYSCAQWPNFTLPNSLFTVFRKTFNCAFHSTTTKYSVFRGGGILIIYVPQKDEVYCIIFRNYLCLLNSTR